MGLEENKAIVRKFIKAYNKQNLDLFDDIVAPDFIDHTHQQQGLENLKQVFKLAFKGMPDMHETIEDIIAEGDKVWVLITYTGTHTGEWFGLAPTGKKVTSRMVAIYQIVNGKLVEGRFLNEQLDMLKHLGIIEYTEKGSIFDS